MKINIFGDFKASCVSDLKISSDIQIRLNEACINLVNFEAPVKSNGERIKKSGPNIYQDIASPLWLENRGFNAVSLANNHTMDYGGEGLAATKSQFNKAVLMGAGTWDEAYKIYKFPTKEGLLVGILCCTHYEFGTLAERNGIGCAWSMSPEICRLIKKEHSEVDFLIVMPHGGVEYMDQPLPEWREVYKLWVDLGADAVIGSHPHVPQGWEIYNGKPICYSLGNFCFYKGHEKVAKARKYWFESLCCCLEIERPHECVMKIQPLVFNQEEKLIYCNDSKEFSKHIEGINSVLLDSAKYVQTVNNYLKKLLPTYLNQFSRSGVIVSLFSKGFLKGFVDGLIGKGFYRKHHAINNIRCESHRWAVLRAIDLQEKQEDSGTHKQRMNRLAEGIMV